MHWSDRGARLVCPRQRPVGTVFLAAPGAFARAARFEPPITVLRRSLTWGSDQGRCWSFRMPAGPTAQMAPRDEVMPVTVAFAPRG